MLGGWLAANCDWDLYNLMLGVKSGGRVNSSEKVIFGGRVSSVWG